MNYNDQIQEEQTYVLNTEQQECNDIRNNSSLPNKGQKCIKKNKKTVNYLSRHQNFKGKQNSQCNIQHLGTNHSFNGFFNQNKRKLNINTCQQKNAQSTEYFLHQNNLKNKQRNISGGDFNSSGKLSNFQFMSDSTQSISKDNNILHPETQKFIQKYFPENYQTMQYYGHFIDIQDFAEILLEEYENVVGKENTVNLIQNFTNKIFLIFGDKIYFDQLFQTTSQRGMLGLIFQVFKSIEQDQKQKKVLGNLNVCNQLKFTSNQSKSLLNQSRTSKGSKFSNNIKMNQGQSRLTLDSSIKVPYSTMSNMTSQKISLDQFFNNNSSKCNMRSANSKISSQNLQEIKIILEQYIEQMYQEAEQKLSKKYCQQLKRISLKYKDTQKLLQKVNQKISNYYDSITLEKQHQKKIKSLKQKQTDLQTKIKDLQFDLKFSKDEVQKEKSNNGKLKIELQKLQLKLEKYQNAIFQKAMQKNSIQNSFSSTTQNKEFYSTQSINNEKTIYQGIAPQKQNFQVKVNAYAQHRSNNVPITSNIRSYSPYNSSKQVVTPLTPTHNKQHQRRSLSPFHQRISFNKAPNPINSNNNLKISTVQRVEIGQPINLRPVSPIGKLNSYTLQSSNQRNYSPINIKFSTSRIDLVSPVRRP